MCGERGGCFDEARLGFMVWILGFCWKVHGAGLNMIEVWLNGLNLG